ncbi:Cysteine-rich secretory protein family protein [Allorhodopirellula heiligendammensis]|uniref:Cysteine-rich secretory protein family protein n=2 Tax=Allorhodopirellula heiligendammensis TaxID=2714739 RepID=A0A5C6BY44_9BACT|nr:Cysteine-rich secretory protein family protein [Allorhodopirellula heiligendammensis]
MRFSLLTFLLLLPVMHASADPPTDTLVAEVEKAIFKETNQFRDKHDLPSLSKSAELTKAASKFATFMAESGKYGHRADGSTPAKRAKAAGYQYCVVRENIAYRTNTGEVTAESLTRVFVPGWIDSPPHRKNMLAEHVTETGIAVATSDEETYYAVVLFGRPKSATIELTITNESGQEQAIVVAADGRSQEIEMPPRGVVTVQQCFPTTVSLKREKGDRANAKVTVTESVELVVTEGAIKTRAE